MLTFISFFWCFFVKYQCLREGSVDCALTCLVSTEGRFTRRTIVHVADNEVQMNDERSSLLEHVATGIITEDTTYLHHVKATDDYCHSYFRCSTYQFPILLTSVSMQLVQRRCFGSKPVNSISILLCMHCNVFQNKQHDLFQLSKSLFKYAWPSVIW